MYDNVYICDNVIQNNNVKTSFLISLSIKLVLYLIALARNSRMPLNNNIDKRFPNIDKTFPFDFKGNVFEFHC